MMTSQDGAALSACSKQLLHHIHSLFTGLSVQEAHVKDVLTGHWPQLALLMVQPVAFFEDLRTVLRKVLQLKESQFQLMATLEISEASQRKAALVICAKLQTDQHKSLGVAFPQLQDLHWRHMSSLSSLTITVHSHGEALMAQMAQLEWPCLKNLSLDSSWLGHACFTKLAKWSAPRLETLNLACNHMDQAAMTALVQGSWPLLTKLVLDNDRPLHAAALAVISTAAPWECLRKLSLRGNQLDNSHIRSVALLHDQLEHLDLSNTALDAAALAPMASQPWPHLQSLSMKSNNLTASAIAILASAQMPELHNMNMADNHLCSVAADFLVKSAWYELGCLSLHDNQLDDKAILYLVHGQWPELWSMTLYGNDISVQGVELLLAGSWPQLSRLILDDNLVCPSTFKCLNLNPQKK